MWWIYFCTWQRERPTITSQDGEHTIMRQRTLISVVAELATVQKFSLHRSDDVV